MAVLRCGSLERLNYLSFESRACAVLPDTKDHAVEELGGEAAANKTWMSRTLFLWHHWFRCLNFLNEPEHFSFVGKPDEPGAEIYLNVVKRSAMGNSIFLCNI